jgi:hypothetical protein
MIRKIPAFAAGIALWATALLLVSIFTGARKLLVIDGMTDDWSSEEDDLLVADVPRSGATPAFADPGGNCAIEHRARLLCLRRPRMVSFSLLPPIREQSRLVVSAAAEALAECVPGRLSRRAPNV